MTRLQEDEIVVNLKHLDGWSLCDNAICKQFKFKDFKTTFLFMTSVAELAEQLNHHPTWTNTYNQLHITLSTHDAGGLTVLDFELAKQINTLQHGF